MNARASTIWLRLAAGVTAALLAFAALADNEAICAESPSAEALASTWLAGGVSHETPAPPTAPCDHCAARPCRTPLSVAPVTSIVPARETTSNVVVGSVLPPICADPASPPTPPPLGLR